MKLLKEVWMCHDTLHVARNFFYPALFLRFYFSVCFFNSDCFTFIYSGRMAILSKSVYGFLSGISARKYPAVCCSFKTKVSLDAVCYIYLPTVLLCLLFFGASRRLVEIKRLDRAVSGSADALASSEQPPLPAAFVPAVAGLAALSIPCAA